MLQREADEGEEEEKEGRGYVNEGEGRRSSNISSKIVVLFLYYKRVRHGDKKIIF